MKSLHRSILPLLVSSLYPSLIEACVGLLPLLEVELLQVVKCRLRHCALAMVCWIVAFGVVAKIDDLV